jgi:hypothetical protein
VSSSEDVAGSNQSASADVDVVSTFLLEDGHLPGIFTELAVTIDVRKGLDATGDSERVTTTAGSGRKTSLVVGRLRGTTAHLTGSTGGERSSISAQLTSFSGLSMSSVSF